MTKIQLKQALSNQWSMPKQKNFNPNKHKAFRDYEAIKEIQRQLNELKTL